MNNPESGLSREDVISQKAEIIADGDEMTPEILVLAEDEVGRMEAELGSLGAVSSYLELETILYESQLEELHQQVYNEMMATFKAEFQYYLEQYGSSIAEQSENNPDEARVAAENILSNLFISSRAVFLRNFKLAPTLENDALTARIICLNEEITRSVLKMAMAPFVAGAPGSPPDLPPSQNARKLTQLQKTYHVFELALTAGASPPMPPPNEPHESEDYEEVIPTEIENVYWDPNEEYGLEFDFKTSWMDEQGRERRFFICTLVDRRDGKNFSLDLSHYIGEEALFEGTAGTILATHKNVKFSGVARDMKSQLNYWPIALNVEYMKQSESFLTTIFHELGHSYIFMNKLDQKIFGREAGQGFLATLLKRKEYEKPRGIAWYRKAIADLPEELQVRGDELTQAKQQLYELENARKRQGAPGRWYEIEYKGFKIPSIETHLSKEEENRISEINKEADQIKNFEKYSALASTNRDAYTLASQHPKVNLVRSIFHERNAVAFAIRQVRKLSKSMDLSPDQTRAFIARARQSLKSASVLFKDERYDKGLDK